MRIQIVGTSGSGKSTFADDLSEILNYPRIEIDHFQFSENWVKRSDEDLDRDLIKALEPKNWVACGNYFSSSAKIYEKADYIIWLKYSLWKILWRVTIRTFKRIFSKEPVCNGNVETIQRQFFSKNSIYVWVFKTYRKRIKRYTEMCSDSSLDHKWIIVTNSIEREICLEKFRKE